MRRFGNRLAAYLVLAVGVVLGIGWYLSGLERPGCNESDTGCVAELGALVTCVVVLGTVMPCVVFFGEMIARDRRKLDTARN